MSTGSTRDLGTLILGVWLVLTGLSSLIALGLPPVAMSAIALIAGIMILAGR